MKPDICFLFDFVSFHLLPVVHFEMTDLTKYKTWRSEKYLAWVRTQPSCISGMPADDAHHIKGHGMGGSVKAPDWAVIPLTREEHTLFHFVGHKRWEQANGNQLEHVARTLGRAIELGVITIKGEKP